MSEARWSDVDRYFDDLVVRPDAALDAAQEEAARAGLPAISVSPAQGKLLHVLARGVGARRILEIGTLAGYSTIWLARALPPDGTLVTLEYEPRHAAVAQRNLERAGVADRVDVRIGAALDSLPRLATEGAGPFDFVFIDADKGHYPEYLDWAVRLGRAGTLILADNVVRHGDIVDPSASDPAVKPIRRFLDAVSGDSRLSATAIQTVGSKGYDGFALVVVLQPGGAV